MPQGDLTGLPDLNKSPALHGTRLATIKNGTLNPLLIVNLLPVIIFPLCHNPLVCNLASLTVDTRQLCIQNNQDIVMKEHPDKHIRAAIDYALTRGWIFITGGKSAHCFGRLICGTARHREYMMSIWSTPAVPINHARQIIRMVDRCQVPLSARINHKKD
ncbi:hypothetical protein DET57_101245 [Klebsiella oxytoca]|uniref:Uncharacterized protein n=1 Tax=Klebsiella oxytoca TaxID=571 RepID=A0A318G1A3_KLEOX|nr:hypothetical protein DET57_101245 [Klebsiella oxytoca]